MEAHFFRHDLSLPAKAINREAARQIFLREGPRILYLAQDLQDWDLEERFGEAPIRSGRQLLVDRDDDGAPHPDERRQLPDPQRNEIPTRELERFVTTTGNVHAKGQATTQPVPAESGRALSLRHLPE